MANQYNNKVALSDGTVLIDLSQDDVKPEHVQKNIHFHDKSGVPQVGTNTKTVDASEVTAEAAEVLAGRTFGKGDRVETGTMPDNSGSIYEMNTTSPVTIPLGYQDGSSKVKISDNELAKLKPENIKQGVSILGVEGDFGADDIEAQAKTVKPTFAEQVIQPDEGYTFLTSVTVQAIGVEYRDNDAGGRTVIIG